MTGITQFTHSVNDSLDVMIPFSAKQGKLSSAVPPVTERSEVTVTSGARVFHQGIFLQLNQGLSSCCCPPEICETEIEIVHCSNARHWEINSLKLLGLLFQFQRVSHNYQ